MMARRIAGRGRCNTSQSITSVPRGSDRCSSGESMPGVGRMAECRCRRWSFKCSSPALALTTNAAVRAARSTLFTGAAMKPLSLLTILALVAACAQSPTAPPTQSGVRSSLSVPAGISAARNPAGTGQPGASCGAENAQTEPKGFGTGGFANAESRYAGSDGTPSLANGSSHAVSQYDVACYQLSNK